MPEYSFHFSDRSWQLACRDATIAMLEGAGPDIRFHLSEAEPVTTGFDLNTSEPRQIDKHFPDHAESRYEALVEKARRQGYIDPPDNEELVSVKRTLAARGIHKK